MSKNTIGMWPIWEMLVTTLVGAFLLWKGNWRPLVAGKESQGELV